MGLDIRVEVDGGINDSTSDIVINAGADTLVSGSYLFRSANMGEAAGKLRGLGI